MPNKTRIYASGPHAQAFAQLTQFGLDVRILGPEEGKAKAIKICYATLTKGTQALCTESFVSAKRLGVFDGLMTELETSQKGLLKFAQDGLQQMPPKAHRWVAEMFFADPTRVFANLSFTQELPRKSLRRPGSST